MSKSVKIKVVERSLSVKAEDFFKKKVVKFGERGAHITIPSKYLGRNVVVAVEVAD